MQTDAASQEIVSAYKARIHDLRIFMNVVLSYVGEHPSLNRPDKPIVHSHKSRLKDPEHLQDKVKRKQLLGRAITADNLFFEITDLAGVRILHLYQDDFRHIDKVIRNKIAEGDWVLGEKGKSL